eukprot:m.182051 g.182051  ORF g.182051 m.182051 type:complete len:239 (-) comp18453_c0_seq4:136-852(-)
MGAIVDAVVVLVNQLAGQQEDDTVWKVNAQRLLDLTGTVPLGLYECPEPYHRCLPASTLQWCAETQRFIFHKDTCCKTGPILEKIKAVRSVGNTPFSFYNANVATLRYSLQKSGNGFSGICANFYPQLVSYLCKHFESSVDAVELQNFLSVAENVVMFKYPVSAKAFLGMFEGLGISTRCRKPNPPELNEEEMLKLEALHAQALGWCKRLGLPRLNPATGEASDAVPDTLNGLTAPSR